MARHEYSSTPSPQSLLFCLLLVLILFSMLRPLPKVSVELVELLDGVLPGDVL